MYKTIIVKNFSTFSIRCIWREEEWWFFIEDLIGILLHTDAPYLFWLSLKTQISLLKSQGRADDWALLNIHVVKIGRKFFDYTNKEGVFCLLNNQNTKAEESEALRKWLNTLDICPT